mmetsp:Transcript_7434/g.13424  ORF Transcript_7434/g.13424 Transcript_7434/m.13424 type:complete len:132 (+) Transcript_7434:1263-1658(+)
MLQVKLLLEYMVRIDWQEILYLNASFMEESPREMQQIKFTRKTDMEEILLLNCYPQTIDSRVHSQICHSSILSDYDDHYQSNFIDFNRFNCQCRHQPAAAPTTILKRLKLHIQCILLLIGRSGDKQEILIG